MSKRCSHPLLDYYDERNIKRLRVREWPDILRQAHVEMIDDVEMWPSCGRKSTLVRG